MLHIDHYNWRGKTERLSKARVVERELLAGAG